MKKGITFSAFDLFHAGHVKMLEEAKTKCDYLIVGLQLDPSIDRPEKNKPTQSIIERYVQLKGCKFIDEIIPYVTEEDLMDILSSFKIDIRIIGEEYKEKDFTGKEYCKKKGIEIYYNKREHRFSSSALRKQVTSSENIKKN
ncbi:MAG: adenylyltransferase/cytidyltransferase family protein [Flavobacteriaceae bacterium]